MISEVGLWLLRIVKLLPELIGLWESTRTDDASDQFRASKALIRAMERQRAQEEIEAGGAINLHDSVPPGAGE